MRQFRLSSLCLLIAIAALAIFMFVQQRQAAVREARLRDRLEMERYRSAMIQAGKALGQGGMLQNQPAAEAAVADERTDNK